MRDKKIRVLHTMPDLRIGGVAKFVLELLDNLDHNKFEHILCVFGKRAELEHMYREIGVSLNLIEHKGFATSYKTIASLKKFLVREKIDVIHNHLFLDRVITGIAGKMMGIPIITTLHTTTNPYKSPRIATQIKALIEDYIGRVTTNLFVAVSKEVKLEAEKHRMVKSNKCIVNYSGINIGDYNLLEVDREVKEECKNFTPIIIHVGRLIPTKGQKDLIEIMPKITKVFPSAILILIGEGNYRRELEKCIEENGISQNVLMLGNKNNVKQYLKVADLFAFTSIEEGLGLSIIEAMASELPVVAYDIPPINEVVQHGISGILVERGDKEKLFNSIIHLLENKEISYKYGEMGKKIVSHKFNVYNTTKVYENLYHQYCKK